MPQKFKVGLVQMSTTPDPDKICNGPSTRFIRPPPERRANCLPARTLPDAVFLPARRRQPCSIWPNPFPARPQRGSPLWRSSFSIVLIASLFEKRAAGRLPQHGRDLRCGRLARGHLSQDAHPRRSALLREVLLHAGRPGLPRVRHGVGRVGTLVCWDQWYPEGARLTALQGAQRLFYPTAIGWHPSEKAEFGASQHDAWRTIQRAHAIANGVFVAVVNRVGHETGDIRGKAAPGDGLEFWGGSFLCDPFGRVSPKPHTTRKKSWWAKSILERWKTSAATGPSCATAASTATHKFTSRLID